MSGKPFVVAATIAKNRAWTLPRWCAALHAQTRPVDAVAVLLNDCTDDSFDVAFASMFAEPWNEIPRSCWTYNTGDKGNDRIAPRYSIANLAYLRNTLISRVLEQWPQASHIWSVDSDLLPAPNVLALLLSADLPVVAAVVANNAQGTALNYMLGWRERLAGEDGERGTGYVKHVHRNGRERDVLARTEPVQVAMTGACVLVKREVLDAGVSYADHPQGEDIAWSLDAQAKGFLLAVHPAARTRHTQADGSEWRV